jgi:hypothetical protein
VFLLLLIISFSACKRKEPSIVYIPEEIKEYSIFQNDSYWVFKNETTGVIDSTFIQDPPQYTYTQGSDDVPSFEVCYLKYDSKFITRSQINWEQYLIGFRNGLVGPCLRAESFQPGYVKKFDSYSLFKNINYFDSLEINSKVYYKVMNTFYQTTNSNDDTLMYTYYLAKSIGLVKVNLHVSNYDTTWSLLRYHVVQ